MAPVTKLYGTGGKRAAQMCRKSGGSVTAKKAVHKHEDHLHPGKPKTKLKAGGKVKGKAAAERPDRRARGGKIGSVVINIKGNGQGDAQADAMKQDMAAKAGLQKGVALGAQMAAAKGPMPGPGPGGPGVPPPGAMAPPGAGAPPPPMMPRARGGSVKRAGGGSVPRPTPRPTFGADTEIMHGPDGELESNKDGYVSYDHGKTILEPVKVGSSFNTSRVRHSVESDDPQNKARGGKIHMTASAAGGKGRLEKAAMAKASQPHRRGGSCS